MSESSKTKDEILQEEWLKTHSPIIGPSASFCQSIESDKQRSKKSSIENNPHRFISVDNNGEISKKAARLDKDALSNLASIKVDQHRFLNKKIYPSGRGYYPVTIIKEKFRLGKNKKIITSFECSDGRVRSEKAIQDIIDGKIKPKSIFSKSEFKILEDKTKKIKITEIRKKVINDFICKDFTNWLETSDRIFEYSKKSIQDIPGIFIPGYNKPTIFINSLEDYAKLKTHHGKLFKFDPNLKKELIPIFGEFFEYPDPLKSMELESYELIIKLIKSKINTEDNYIEFKSFDYFLFDFSLYDAILVNKLNGELYRYDMKKEKYIMNLIEKDLINGNFNIYNKTIIINEGKAGIEKIKAERLLELKFDKKVKNFEFRNRGYTKCIGKKLGYLFLKSIHADTTNLQTTFHCIPKCHPDGVEVKLTELEWLRLSEKPKCKECLAKELKILRDKENDKKIEKLFKTYGIRVSCMKDYSKEMAKINRTEQREKEKEMAILQEKNKMAYEKMVVKFNKYKQFIYEILTSRQMVWVGTNDEFKNDLISVNKNSVWVFDIQTRSMYRCNVVTKDIVDIMQRIYESYKHTDCMFYPGVK